MKLTRIGYGIKALLVLLCFGLQYGLLDAKAIRKSKHAIHTSGSKKHHAPKGDFCVDHSYCVKYSEWDCAEGGWPNMNCPRMCRICEYEGPELLKLPAVLYYKKGDKKHGISGKKHKNHKRTVIEKRDKGDRRDVVFLSRPADYTPTKQSPTTSYTLFDYKGMYRNWQFLYPDQHPVNMHYAEPYNKAADPNQPNAPQQQTAATQDATAAAAAAPAAPAVAPAAAAPAAAAAAPVAAAPAVAAPVVPQVGQAAAGFEQPAAPVAGQLPVAAQPEAANETIQLLNQTVALASNATFEPAVANASQANQAIMVGATAATNNTSSQTVASGAVDLTSTGQSFTQDVMVDPQAEQQAEPKAEPAAEPQADKYQPWTCCIKQPRPPGCKKCPDLPKAPPLNYVFKVICDDLYPHCGYGYSNCNDTWFQMHCPKRCNLCKAKDQQNVAATETKEIYPSEVKNLTENSELESDLVAPAPGRKPLVAKYTLRVKPKLLNGVPQTQEIRIMPPNKAGTAGYVKPLMVLKQNITKPMIENIEIDVPQKGAKFSSKPSVEVIEGDHTEMLTVSKGQAIVEDPAQKSKTSTEEIKEAKPKQDSAAQTATETDKTESSPATQATADQTQTQSPWDTQATETAAAATQADAPVTDATPAQAEATTAQADTTAVQSDASASQSDATATQADAQATQADAQATQADAQATQTAAYTTTPSDATAAQADATVAQTTAPAAAAPAVAAAPAAAAYTATQSAAAPVTQPDVSATQTAAYTNTETCTDHNYCGPYTTDRCGEPWISTNCKRLCNRC